MDQNAEVLVQLVIPLALLVLAYFTGTVIERRHYRSIRERERSWSELPVITLRSVPSGWRVVDSGLVSSSVVISVDYFKRFLAGLRMIFGGRVKTYESLLDRARREALLRLKEQAQSGGYQAVINVRVETTRMANARGDSRIAGLEVLAFGTALELREAP